MRLQVIRATRTESKRMTALGTRLAPLHHSSANGSWNSPWWWGLCIFCPRILIGCHRCLASLQRVCTLSHTASEYFQRHLYESLTSHHCMLQVGVSRKKMVSACHAHVDYTQLYIWKFWFYTAAFMLYWFLGVLMDGPAALIGWVTGLHISPHFDAPYLSASHSEFWSHRWNLTVGNMLRYLCYDPVYEGRFCNVLADSKQWLLSLILYSWRSKGS